MQGPPKNVPRLFNPAEDYDDRSVLVVTLSEKTITLTAKEVTGMPWQQFVRLMKVRASTIFQVGVTWQCTWHPMQKMSACWVIEHCSYFRPIPSLNALLRHSMPFLLAYLLTHPCYSVSLNEDIALQRYITQIGALLPEAEAQPKSAAAQRAEQLGREAMYIGSCLAAGIPRHTRTLYCLKLQESGPEQSRAPPQLWMAIMLQMNLSASQRQVNQCS